MATGLEMNKTHQLVVYTDDVLRENISTIGTEALLDARKEIGLRVYTERTQLVPYAHVSSGERRTKL
jgi:hypothetical protein